MRNLSPEVFPSPILYRSLLIEKTGPFVLQSSPPFIFANDTLSCHLTYFSVSYIYYQLDLEASSDSDLLF